MSASLFTSTITEITPVYAGTVIKREEADKANISDFDVTGDKGGIKISYICNDPRNMVIYVRKGKTLVMAHLASGSWIKTEKSYLLPITDKGTYTVSLNRLDDDGEYTYNLYHTDINYDGMTYFTGFDSIVQEYSKASDKARELTKKCKTPKKKIFAIHKYITSHYVYDNDKSENAKKGLTPVESWTWEQTPGQTWLRQTGVCADIAILETEMLRSIGIETKLGESHIHEWTEVRYKDSGGWRIIDPTFDLGKKKTENSIYRERDEFYSPDNRKTQKELYGSIKIIVKKTSKSSESKTKITSKHKEIWLHSDAKAS